MFCPKCGTSLNGNEDFCSTCGFDLKETKKLEQNVKNNVEISQNIEAIPNNTKVNIQSDNKKSIPKKLIIAIAALLIVIVAIIMTMVFLGKKNKDDNKYGSSSGMEGITTVLSDIGIPKFIDGDFANILVNDQNDALKAIEKIKDQLKINDVNSEFKLDYSETVDNITYYRFNQIYKDTEVYNNNIIISADKDGKVLGFSGYYVPNINIDINEKKTKEELENIVKKELGEDAEIIESKKYVYAVNNSQNLVYVIKASSSTEMINYIIDANNGNIISKVDSFLYADAYEFTGNGINGAKEKVIIEEYLDVPLTKKRYRLFDPIRKIQIVNGSEQRIDWKGAIQLYFLNKISPMEGEIDGNDFKFNKNTETDKQHARNAITTLKTFEDIYDYYLNILNRKSYDGNGAKITVVVNLNLDRFTNNASWSAELQQFLIGYSNGVSFGLSKDVMAHEFTHAVISEISQFALNPIDENSAFETGALNEGIADIMGHLIEGKNWTMNEAIKVERSAENPETYADPSIKGEKYYFPDSYIKDGTLEQFLKEKNVKKVSEFDHGGIHGNSNVVSHAAYLMYKNGAFSSKEEMAKIWYNALYLMSSYSDFNDCALAVIKTAKNFKLSSESLEIIENAFIETKMLEGSAKITGTVISGERNLNDVQIEIYDSNDKLVYELKSDEDGKFSQSLKVGKYKFMFKKKGFNELTEEIEITGDTEYIVKLSYTKAKGCTSGNCVTVTMYMLDGDESSVGEGKETFVVDYGTVIGANEIVKYTNQAVGSNMISTDGETFYMNGLEGLANFGWYYKGTDEKFSFDKPIKENIEIEMKYLNGMIDNDVIQDFSNMFK